MLGLRRFGLIAGSVTAVACGSPAEPHQSASLEITGEGATDTIGTLIDAPLSVVARDAGGNTAPYVEIEFTAVRVPSRSDYVYGPVPTVYPSFDGAPDRYSNAILRVSTDGLGRASVRIRLGDVAGEGKIAIRADALGVEDTALYTVLPGNAHHIRVEPTDTSLFVGSRYQLRAVVLDFQGNPRSDLAAATASTGGLVDISGLEITGRGVGRAEVTLSHDVATARASVSVMPRGALAFTEIHNFDNDMELAVWVMNLDGSRRREISRWQRPYSSYDWEGPMPAWSPDGSRLAYNEDDSLIVSDLAGNRRKLFAPLTMTSLLSWTADATWIYFTAREPQAGIWRVHPDGTGAEFVVSGALARVSPDGRTLVLSTRDWPGAAFALYDLTTAVMTPLAERGAAPSWSPDGAYLALPGDPDLKILGSDGTLLRSIAHPWSTMNSACSWSVDQVWLLCGGGTGLWLVRVSTGEMIPVPTWLLGAAQPSLRAQTFDR